MLNAFCACNGDRHEKDDCVSGWLLGHVTAIVLLCLCLPGCSRSEATSCKAKGCSLTQSMFAGKDKPSQCDARCIPAAVAIAREGLGVDPEAPKGQVGDNSQAIFESLRNEGSVNGSTIIRVPAIDVIEKMTEGPATPVVLVNKTGHLYILFGAIRVNDKMLYQVVHGGEPVSLITKQALSEGSFQDAWRFQKKKAVGTPIHVGLATIEIDKLWHNFGETFPDKSLECTFHIKNAGNKAVILDKPAVSCQCTVPNLGEKTELAPGKIFDLKVVTKASGSTSLSNSIGLTFYEKGNGTPRQVQLSLIGSQRESMEIAPTKLDFGLMIPGKPCSRTVTLREKPTDRFVLKDVDIGNLPLERRIEATRDQNGLATYRVHLELKVDERSSKEQQGELILTTDSLVRPKVTIPITFQIEPLIRAIPSVISLGAVAVGESREENVQFVSRCGEPLDVQIESYPDECSITINQTKAPSEMIVAVKLKEPGIWQGIIRVRMQTPSGKEVIDVKCVGYGRENPR